MKEPGHHETLAHSSFNVLERCAHYLSSGEETPQSARGTSIHLVTAEMLRKGKTLETFWLKERDEKEACEWLWEKTHEELREIHGIEERVEIWDQRAGELITFGRCDCYGEHTSGMPGLIDWKSGRGGEGSHKAQMVIYALGLMDKLGVSEVIGTLLYCDQKRVERYTITLEEAEALLSSIIAAQADPESPYKTGSYCQGCKLRSSCPAWVEPATKALVTLGASDLQANIEQGLEKVKADPVLLGKFIHGWRKLEKLIEHADLTKTGIEYAEAGEGMEGWRVEERSGRSHFTEADVLQLLESDLSNEYLAKILKIDNTALKKLAPKMRLSPVEMPPYKCLVWKNGSGA